MTPAKRCYFVFEDGGRILAVAPAAAGSAGDAIRLGWEPVPEQGQRVAEIELTAEQEALPLHELLEQFEIELGTDPGWPRLRRRGDKA